MIHDKTQRYYCCIIKHEESDSDRGSGFVVISIIVNAPKQALAKDADGLIKELVNLAERGHEINFDAREMLGG